MLRLVFPVLVVVAIVMLFTRSPALRRGFHVVLALMVLYAVLKMTGVIEAILPSRDGVY